MGYMGKKLLVSPYFGVRLPQRGDAWGAYASQGKISQS